MACKQVIFAVGHKKGNIWLIVFNVSNPRKYCHSGFIKLTTCLIANIFRFQLSENSKEIIWKEQGLSWPSGIDISQIVMV